MSFYDAIPYIFLLGAVASMGHARWQRRKEKQHQRARIVPGSVWICGPDDRLPMTVTRVDGGMVHFTYGSRPIESSETIGVFEHFQWLNPDPPADSVPSEPEPDLYAMTDAELLALWFAGNQSVNLRAAGRLMALCGFTSPRLADAQRMKAERWSLRQVKEAGQMERMLHVWHTHGRNANRFCHEAPGLKVVTVTTYPNN